MYTLIITFVKFATLCSLSSYVSAGSSFDHGGGGGIPHARSMSKSHQFGSQNSFEHPPPGYPNPHGYPQPQSGYPQPQSGYPQPAEESGAGNMQPSRGRRLGGHAVVALGMATNAAFLASISAGFYHDYSQHKKDKTPPKEQADPNSGSSQGAGGAGGSGGH